MMTLPFRRGPVALLILSALLAACTDPIASEYERREAALQRIAASAAGWSVRPAGDLNSFFDCLAEGPFTLVSAHRGGPVPGFPENAIETFRNTLDQVPALVELDVATSADGVLFLMHDDTLDRTTNGSGAANEQDWADIRRLRLRDNQGNVTDFSPPKFSDALAALKDRTITQIDFKRSTRFEDVIDEIRRQGAEDRVVLIAYSIAQASKLHRLAPDVMISLSLDSQSALNQAVAAGIPAERLIAFTGLDDPNPRLNTILASRDVEVIFGTLGGARSIDRAIEESGKTDRYVTLARTGIDILATDQPIAAHRALARDDRAAAGCGIEDFRP